MADVTHPSMLAGPLIWTPSDDLVVKHLRALAMDAVQRPGNGHPGTAMALAPVAYLLFHRLMSHDPQDPSWLARDRFVLSAGHSSLTLYSQLFLCNYGLTMKDLESFRSGGSLTPGHPEYGHTTGVETTTGPLGQGLATAVGMAMAERFEQGLLPGAPLAHRVWVIASDGDLEEGISSEASSLAGTQKLGHLVVIWDDNRISIEGDTSVAFTEDVCARYRAYGWDVHEVDMHENGDVDVVALYSTLQRAANNTEQPSFIRMRTTIAWPAPHARGTAKAHGSALGPEEVAATKKELGLDPHKTFQFDEALIADIRESLSARVRALKTSWNQEFTNWQIASPDGAALLNRLLTHKLPDNLDAHLPIFEGVTSMSTRKASGLCINGLADALPELWGGSADLAESNNTWIEGSLSFLPYFSPSTSPFGRNIHFGIREHAMGAALNGIAIGNLSRPFGGTFLVFSDYMRGSVRLSALMHTPVTFIWTHDSIGLGEDGPTHQPIEHLWSLRAIPGLNVVRPADAHETAAAWLTTLSHREPTGLILTRQDVPLLTTISREDVFKGVARGGYIVESDESPEVILIATGSELSIALAARQMLATQGTSSRVVSMPCTEWFDGQPTEYRESVLPKSIKARVAVEAGATLGWYKYVGTHGAVVGLDEFGSSAPAGELFEKYNITQMAVVDAAQRSILDSTEM